VTIEIMKSYIYNKKKADNNVCLSKNLAY